MLILRAITPADQCESRRRRRCFPQFRNLSVGLAILLFLLPGSVSVLAVSPAEEKAVWNRPGPEWREGPVRYLMSDDEIEEYEALTDERSRAAFISRFWASRDPDPFTDRNEAEEVFWERVAAANELFTATTISGWRTDRGRIYILLGAPDEISNYPVPSATDLDPSRAYSSYRRVGSDIAYGQRGAVEWIYRSLANRRADAGQMVTFIRDETGEFRLSERLVTPFRWEAPLRQSGIPSGSANPGLTRTPAGTTANQPGIVSGSTTSLLADTFAFENLMKAGADLFAFGQAALFEKAEPVRGPMGRVRSEQFFGVIPVQTQLDYFRGEGGTHTLITVGIPEDDMVPDEGYPEEVQIFGRLEKIDDPTQVYQFSTSKAIAAEAPRQTIGGRLHRLYQVRGVLPTGAYRVNLGTRIGARVGTVGNQIEVPDHGGESLILAGPMLAQAVGELTSKHSGKDFVVGQIRMVPKLDPRYRNGSDFGFYFQAYHVMTSPADGLIHLDIDYHIAVRREGVFRPLGQPVTLRDNSAPAHAYTFPLQGWEPGEYLLTVTVEDRTSGAVQSRHAAFRVE